MKMNTLKVTSVLVAIGLLAGLPCSTGAQPPKGKSVKITVILRGAISSDCTQAMCAALKKLPGLKFNEADIQPGEKDRFGHYFTPFVDLEIADTDKLELGAIAKAVAEAKTPKRAEQPPSLNLILYHPALMVVRAEIVALREALADVPGFDARATGGTGAFIEKSVFRVRMDGSGVTRFEDLQQALRIAKLDFRLAKN